MHQALIISLFALASSVDDPTVELGRESLSMKPPISIVRTVNLKCGFGSFAFSYGHEEVMAVRPSGVDNKLESTSGPFGLLKFETDAFEVTETLQQNLRDAFSAYSNLDQLNLHCGSAIDEQEAEFLLMELVGRYRGDTRPFQEACIQNKGYFFEETTRKYLLKDGVLYRESDGDELGYCVAGQTFFSTKFEIDRHDDQ